MFTSEAPLSEDDRAVRAAYEQVQPIPLRRSELPLPGPLSPLLITVLRDERDALPDFLRHYRLSGVERFVFIDNGSTDGSLDYIMRQPDSDVFTVAERFDWRRKQGWINRIIDFYGLDRWYLCVDADEHVVFDDIGRRGFPELVAHLERHGQVRVRGFLLDMYSEMPLLASASGDDIRLAEAYPYFDSSGYTEGRTAHLISRLGGPRQRAFGSMDPEFKPQLTKYPLFRLRDGEFFANPHHIWPCAPNFRTRCVLALMHFKFHGEFAIRVARAVEEETYWSASREYKVYLEALARSPEFSLFDPTLSRRYTSPQDLIDLGLIEPIGWGADSDDLSAALRAGARRRRAELLSGHTAGRTQ